MTGHFPNDMPLREFMANLIGRMGTGNHGATFLTVETPAGIVEVQITLVRVMPPAKTEVPA